MTDAFIKDLLDLPEQVNRGDFVLRLSEGGDPDPHPKIKEALRAVLDSVDPILIDFRRVFAERLKQWAAQDSELAGVLRIESVLHNAVGPVAKLHPVLLIVLDGLSMANYRELLSDLLRRDWAEVRPPEGIPSGPVLATIPSPRFASRTSRWSTPHPYPRSRAVTLIVTSACLN